MKKTFLFFLILGIALVGACNRTSNQTPSSGPAAKVPGMPQAASSAPRPDSSTTASQAQNESPSAELSKEQESNSMPRPGQGGADHSTPAREPGNKG